MAFFSIETFLPNNFADVLLNQDFCNNFVRQLEKSLDEFRANVKDSFCSSKTTSGKLSEKKERQSEHLSKLLRKKKDLRDSIVQQKLDLKVSEKNSEQLTKRIISNKDAITKFEESMEKLSVVLVDLEQEAVNRKNYLQREWDALKKAGSYYKDTLDFHVDTDMGNPEKINITLFYSENAQDHKFQIAMCNQNNCWKVDKIEPGLTLNEKEKLKNVVSFEKQSEVKNIPLFLHYVRSYFKNKYLENSK